ncbi:helix-turn-helix domain-containing protein [Aureimonas leprariae]|uniref:Helix-turn-helix domain-containing protein n=1 Tax=Plantimonas leprariae TaxID=2615207 RepID=A0A7V7PT46_9HYPH|nr:helix-turn-helix domain-containing protein [Aureimonas leprariae]KAB0682738.1 helix-turn-helix domain-containing protein [Aureimonas leprariae]
MKRREKEPSSEPGIDAGSSRPGATARTGLLQDPHAVREPRENNLELAIGHEVRSYRRALGITVADLAASTGLSLGMLSKIENGNISPSLTTLQTLSRALGVPLTAFLKRYEEERNAVFVRAGEGIELERRGTRAGHQYNLLGHIHENTSGVTVEPYLITLTAASDVFPTFQHTGMEFLYMLEGEVIYRHGNRRFHMRPGDSLFFDADAPHGPEELVVLPSRYLSLISYPQARSG